MPGKKKTKQVKSTKFTSAEQMEREYRSFPSKIIAQYRKEISALKQTAAKIKTTLQKAQSVEKTAKKKYLTIAAALKAKRTPTKQKQLNAAKKSLTKLSKTTATFMTEFKNLQNQINTLITKQNSFNGKPAKTTKAKKTKKATTKFNKKPNTETRTTEKPVQEDYLNMATESELETTDDTSEATS